jgi:hypothetical protein
MARTNIVRVARLMPMIFLTLGFVCIAVALASTVIPLSGVSFGTGPYSVSVFGLSPLTATLLFIGIVFLVMGFASTMAMARHH